LSTTASIAFRPTLFWDAATRVLSFDPDGVGPSSMVLLATLPQGLALSLSDIWTA
jgi:hypothetical protein